MGKGSSAVRLLLDETPEQSLLSLYAKNCDSSKQTLFVELDCAESETETTRLGYQAQYAGNV